MYANTRSNGYGETPLLSNDFAVSNGCLNLVEAASVAQKTLADAVARRSCSPATRAQPILYAACHRNIKT